MKKLAIFVLCTALLASLQVFAQTDCNECPQTNTTNVCDKFLCTNTDMEKVFDETGLSDSQICTARKLQEKYEQETLSVRDRLLYEENVLNEYNATCADKSDIRAQKKKIKKLNKTHKEICKCYDKQFKVMLSDAQRKAYNKLTR